jgi:hypothetical protein
MLTFSKKYFFLAAILFVIEMLIALFVRDSLVRPYVGDYLVVMLLYCAVRTFVRATVWKVALGVLLFSYLVETLQFYQLVNRLGLQDNIIAKTVIGYGFDWADLVAYTFGIITVLAVDRENEFVSRRNYV